MLVYVAWWIVVCVGVSVCRTEFVVGALHYSWLQALYWHTCYGNMMQFYSPCDMTVYITSTLWLTRFISDLVINNETSIFFFQPVITHFKNDVELQRFHLQLVPPFSFPPVKSFLHTELWGNEGTLVLLCLLALVAETSPNEDRLLSRMFRP